MAKSRNIDGKVSPTKPTDKVWDEFSNLILSALGEPMDSERLSEVYCDQRAREYDGKFLDSLMFNIPPAFVPEVMKDMQAVKRGQQVLDEICSLSAEPRTPVFILGYVGTGKSTFLKHYFKVELPKRNLAGQKPIFINFLDVHSDDKAFKADVLRMLLTEIKHIAGYKRTLSRQNLEDIYDEEVAQIRDGLGDLVEAKPHIDQFLAKKVLLAVEGDFLTGLDLCRRILEKLAKRNVRVWLVLDNLDQLFLNLNASLFLICNEIAKTLPVKVVVALRFITWDAIAAHEAFLTTRPRHLCLSLPDVSKLVEKRIDLFFRNSELLEKTFAWSGHSLRIRQLVDDIRDVTRLLVQRNVLGEFLLPLANNSLRTLLDLLTRCFQSWYFFHDPFNSHRYLPSEKNLYKRVIYSLILGNREWFDPSETPTSRIVNLFDSENRQDRGNQLVRIRVIQFLDQRSSAVSLDDLHVTFDRVFTYSEELLFSTVVALTKAGLITLRWAMGGSFQDQRLVRENELTLADLRGKAVDASITASGRLHYRDLMRRVEYVEIMKHSTNVPPDVLEKIPMLDQLAGFKGRRAATMAFLEYLEREEKLEIAGEIRDRLIFDLNFGPIVSGLKREISDQYLEIEREYFSNASRPDAE